MLKHFIKRSGLFIGKNLLYADGNRTNFSSSGSGTENNPYIITTAEQF